MVEASQPLCRNVADEQPVHHLYKTPTAVLLILLLSVVYDSMDVGTDKLRLITHGYSVAR